MKWAKPRQHPISGSELWRPWDTRAEFTGTDGLGSPGCYLHVGDEIFLQTGGEGRMRMLCGSDEGYIRVHANMCAERRAVNRRAL